MSTVNPSVFSARTAEENWSADGALKTTEVGTVFEELVQFADTAVEGFIADKATAEGGCNFLLESHYSFND